MATTRDQVFNRAQQAALAERPRIQTQTFQEIQRILQEGLAEVNAQLLSATGFEAARLQYLQRGIEHTLDEVADRSASEVAAGIGLAWSAGATALDRAIAAGGVDLRQFLALPDTEQLIAMRTFATDRIRHATLDQINAINRELGLVMIGAKSQHEAILAIRRILRETTLARARTIVRTEVGRAFSAAQQQRMEQAVELLPGLKKEWRWSGKLHPRPHHLAINGQVREVDKPFTLGNGFEIMYPRDPRAPARETINCGCSALAHMDHWDTTNVIPFRRIA